MANLLFKNTTNAPSFSQLKGFIFLSFFLNFQYFKECHLSFDPNRKIIFLETGKAGERGSGLRHILENHREDFLKRGISEEQIPDLIIRAITEGKAIGIQGKSRIIYQVEVNLVFQYISLEVSHNGYIVSANPTPTRLINKII